MNQRRLLLEYVGKGVCLSLLGLLAFQGPDWSRTAAFVGLALAGLVVALAEAAFRALRHGERVQGRLAAFLLYLLLDNPGHVYIGLVGGFAVGAALQTFVMGAWSVTDLVIALAGGSALGLGLWLLRQVGNRTVRSGTMLVIVAAVSVAVTTWLRSAFNWPAEVIGGHILLAIPFLYLLTFVGRAEETELEVGLMAVALAVGLGMILPPTWQLGAILLPPALYYVYLSQVHGSLLSFKQVLRGLSYHRLGRHHEALTAYRRALQLEPKNRLASEGLWQVHRGLDLQQILHDPALLRLIDLDLCLNRARDLLLAPKPTGERLDEALKLLTLVLDQRPEAQPAVYYWRAVAHTHAREFEKAVEELRTVLTDADYAPDDPYRRSVLVASWQLATVLHPELRRRLGDSLLGSEGRRLDAIAAVEQDLAATPGDPGATSLKQVLYEGLTEHEYHARAGAGRVLPSDQFDHGYCLGLGQALLADPARWRRGAEFLRIAARGLPAQAPGIYMQITQACRAAGDEDGLRYSLEMAKLAAREVGIAKLPEPEQQAYFSAVKQLAEIAYARGDVDRALENFALFSDSPQAGTDTLKLVTELHERRGDALSALAWNERALMYDPRNKGLLERKDRYYYSVTAAELEAKREAVANLFDVGYCLRKARSLLDLKSGGAEQVEWAEHLAALARVVQPDNVQALTLCARAKLRRGDEEAAIGLLEAARAVKPEEREGSEDTEAWFTACRLLGDLYLQRLMRPDLALSCFADYRKSTKSGADTLFKMGQAYEQLGDRLKAAKCYENVAVYDHPLAFEASLALQRLQAQN